jgi:hypothetical protein
VPISACCRQVLHVARLAGGSGDGAQQGIPEHSGALQDDHCAVRGAALEALAGLLAIVPPAAHAAAMPTLRRLLAKPADLPPAMAELLARLMATLPVALRPLAAADAGLLHAAFAHLAAKGGRDVRLHCARAFPALLTSSSSPASVQLAPGPLLDSYMRLVGDSCVRFPCSCAPC